MKKTREKYLESLLPKDMDYEAKHFPNFEKYARYMGNGVYTWLGITATSTRELFLMGILHKLDIKFKEI